MQPIDELLLKKAATGDMEAFEGLVLASEKLIYSACYRLLGNIEDARDASQEVFIKLYRNIDKCTNSSTYKAWIYRIAYNTCVDFLRKKKGKEPPISINQQVALDENEIEIQLKSDELTPEEKYIQEETKVVVQHAIDKLKETYKPLIVLRDIQGLSYEEIAKVTDIPIGTVKSRISRGRQKLKEYLEATIPEGPVD